MPQNKDLKRLVRARMAETGENYTQALTRLLGLVDLEPLPAAWQITGSRAPDYEAGLLPGITYDGNRVAQLRLRSAVSGCAGFGALVQCIAATSAAGYVSAPWRGRARSLSGPGCGCASTGPRHARA